MLNLIVAVGKNSEIGGPNGLLWHLSSDLKRFKEITMGHPMIMGRKTFESIGRVLPGRTSIVISSSAGSQVNQEGLVWAESLGDAIGKAKEIDEEVFVIGGGQIYEQALPYADRIFITKIDKSFPEANVFFPVIIGFTEFAPELSGEEDGLSWEYGIINRI